MNVQGPAKIVSVLRNIFATLAVAFLIIPTTAGQGYAAKNLGLAVVAWVASIDASPDWTADMSGFSINEAKDMATIERLVITAETGGIAVEIEYANFSGYAETAGGGFSANSLRVARASVKTQLADITVTDVDFDDIGVPPLTAILYDKRKPFALMVSAISSLAKSRMAGGQVAEVEIFEWLEGGNSRILYENVAIGRVADGKIDEIRAGPLRMDTPLPDPIAELTVEKVEARAIDVDAFLHVFDPLRYTAEVGDGSWRPAIGLVAYSNMVMTLPGVRLKFGSMSTEDLKIRQAAKSFSPLFEAAMAEKKLPQNVMDRITARHMPDFLSAFDIGRFALRQVELAATGIDQLTLRAFTVADLSSDGVGEIEIEGFVGAIAGQGAIAVDRFTLGDVVLPSRDLIDFAIGRTKRGNAVNAASLAPKLGLLDAVDVNIQAVDFPGVTLGRLRAVLGNYLGIIPTEVSVNISDLNIAASSLRPEQLRNLIASLGYDRIRANAHFDLDWHETDGTVTLDNFRIDLDDFGNTTANVLLSGLTREAIEDADDITGIVADLTFNRASLSFEDKSVVERSLSMRADLLNVPLDRLRQQLSGALPLMLAVVGNSELVREIVPVLQTFIQRPGTLTIDANPDAPIPMTTIQNTATTRPQDLPGMLSVKITGEPGDEPAAGISEQ